jgi:hypothetical protein
MCVYSENFIKQIYALFGKMQRYFMLKHKVSELSNITTNKLLKNDIMTKDVMKFHYFYSNLKYLSRSLP